MKKSPIKLLYIRILNQLKMILIFSFNVLNSRQIVKPTRKLTASWRQIFTVGGFYTFYTCETAQKIGPYIFRSYYFFQWHLQISSYKYMSNSLVDSSFVITMNKLTIIVLNMQLLIKTVIVHYANRMRLS